MVHGGIEWHDLHCTCPACAVAEASLGVPLKTRAPGSARTHAFCPARACPDGGQGPSQAMPQVLWMQQPIALHCGCGHITSQTPSVRVCRGRPPSFARVCPHTPSAASAQVCPDPNKTPPGHSGEVPFRGETAGAMGANEKVRALHPPGHCGVVYGVSRPSARPRMPGTGGHPT